MKKSVIIIIAIVVLLLSGITTAWANNFYITLLLKGYDTSKVQIVDASYNDDGKEFKVIRTSSKKDDTVLAILTKNIFGLWSITEKQENNEDSSISTIGWVKEGEMKRYSFKDGGTIENEWNIIYSGNNATSLIALKPEQIPDNVTVNIQQNGKYYLIHVVTYSDSNTLSKFDVPKILLDNQCISEE